MMASVRAKMRRDIEPVVGEDKRNFLTLCVDISTMTVHFISSNTHPFFLP